mmetsp:Transcript_14133/g.13945  ORF Transcript_14133/g.13945 Transcript_14133/m.13945 type:complete len:155 (+) Transcript_14133:234-698(+)
MGSSESLEECTPLMSSFCVVLLIVSSQEDRRFRPIAQSEMKDLMCTVSVLHTFEDVGEEIYNWKCDGTHGIVVKFVLPGEARTRSATFLPNVMPEQHWDQKQAIMRAIVKGGGSSRDGHHPEALQTTVQRYQSSKFSLTFEEYEMMRGKTAVSS